MPTHARTWHFFGYSKEIITKISSLHSHLRFRRRLIRVYSMEGIKGHNSVLLFKLQFKHLYIHIY